MAYRASCFFYFTFISSKRCFDNRFRTYVYVMTHAKGMYNLFGPLSFSMMLAAGQFSIFRLIFFKISLIFFRLIWWFGVQNSFIWCKLKTTVLTQPAFIFSESSYFNLKFGINQFKIGLKLAEQWLAKAKILGPVDEQTARFFKKCTYLKQLYCFI